MPKRAYSLAKPYIWNMRTDVAKGGCVFCKAEIQHINDGGVGCIVEAADRKGRMGEYLCCAFPPCEAARKNQREIHRCYNTEHGSEYLEFLGKTCPECGGAVSEVDARLNDPAWDKFFAGEEDL